MGILTDAYRDLVDDSFHRRRADRLERYLAADYQVVDVFRPHRGDGLAGMRAYVETVLAGLRDVRYDVVDTVEQGDRLAVRYVVTGRDREGQRIAASGLSFHHGRDGKLARTWHVGDQRELGVFSEERLTADQAARWMTPAEVAVGPLAAAHRRLVDGLWRRPGPVDDVIAPDYLVHDPFSERIGAGGTVAVNRALRAELADPTFHVLDAFEDGDRLATRFAITGLRAGGPATLPGLSINQFADGRIVRAWIYCRYGALAPVARAAAAEVPA